MSPNEFEHRITNGGCGRHPIDGRNRSSKLRAKKNSRAMNEWNEWNDVWATVRRYGSVWPWVFESSFTIASFRMLFYKLNKSHSLHHILSRLMKYRLTLPKYDWYLQIYPFFFQIWIGVRRLCSHCQSHSCAIDIFYTYGCVAAADWRRNFGDKYVFHMQCVP